MLAALLDRLPEGLAGRLYLVVGVPLGIQEAMHLGWKLAALACPSHAAITAIGTRRRCINIARECRILQPHLLDTQHVEHPAPPEGQKVRVIGLPGLVARHVLVRPVAGVGHIFTTGAVALDTDTRGVDIQRSENATADSFSKNLVFAPPR